MSTILTVNFDGAPPAIGGAGLGDHVPPGGYTLQIKSVSKTTTSTGKDMVKVEYGIVNPEAFAGKKIVENFVLPRANTDDSKFGLQRFHALIVALGNPNMDGKGQQSLDLDRLTGLRVVAELNDSEIPANGNYAARTVSQPGIYLNVNSEDAAKLLSLSAPRSAAPAAAAPAPAAAPPAVAETPAPAPEAPAAPAPAAPANSVEEELSSLFGG